MEKKDICTGIAFYDLDRSKTNVMGIFNFVELWMKNLGYEPKKGAIRTKGYVSKKSKLFKFIKNKIISSELENIESVNFGYVDKNCNTEIFDTLIGFRLDLSIRGEFCVYFDNSFVDFNVEKNLQFIKEVSGFVFAKYGFVFHRERSKGPDIYIMGGSTGLDWLDPVEKIESEKIGKWYRAYSFEDGTYKTGMLRDIYPMNFISKIHLDQPVYGGSLQQWIESSSLHGELEKFNENLWLWTVPEDKTESIANDLKDTGLIVSLRD